jgi:hypothetical protein
MFHCDLSCRLLPDDVFRDLPREAVGNEAEVTGIDRPVLNAELEYRTTACKPKLFRNSNYQTGDKYCYSFTVGSVFPLFFYFEACQCPRALAEYQ